MQSVYRGHRRSSQVTNVNQRHGRLLALSVALASTALTGQQLHAANGTWNGANIAVDTNWSDSGNWVSGIVPGDGSGTVFTNPDTAIFSDTANAGNNAVTLDTNRNIKNIEFASAATQFAIGATGSTNLLLLSDGGSVKVDSNVISTAGSDAINSPIVLEGSTYTFDAEATPVNSALKINSSVTGSPTASGTTLHLTGVNFNTSSQTGNCLIAGTISDGAGPLGLVKDGTATSVWTITGTNNSFTGPIVINSGAIRFNTNVTSVPSTAKITINNTGILRMNVNNAVATSLTINSGGSTGGTSNADTLNLKGDASGGAALTLQLMQTGVTMPAISTPFNLTGTGAAGTGGLTVNGDATFTDELKLGTAMDLGGVNRTFNINTLGTNDTDLQLSGIISDTGGTAGGGIIKTGAGSLKLSNTANTFTGPIEISAGTLKLNGTVSTNVLSGLNNLTIDGGTLNLNGDNLSPGDGNITVASATFNSGTLAGPTSSLFAPAFNFNVATGNTFTVNAILADGTGGPSPLNSNTGTGTIILNKANAYTGATNINAGIVNISSTGSIASTSVSVASGGTLNANGASPNSGLSTSTALVSSGKVFLSANASASSPTLTTVSSVTIHNGGAVTLSDASPANHAGRTVLTTSALTFDGTTNTWKGKLDLNGNDLIIKGGSTIANVTNQLKLGFNAGTGYWNGGNGIVSTAAANDTRFLTTLGSRPSDGTTFDNVTGLTTNDVIVKYTYYGDADLNGTVNGADYQQIDNGFGNHLTGWFNGDFNYDGVVNGSDFALIDNTFNQITATNAAALAITADASPIASPAVLSAVPEPTTLGLLGIAATGLMGRRRRQNTR